MAILNHEILLGLRLRHLRMFALTRGSLDVSVVLMTRAHETLERTLSPSLFFPFCISSTSAQRARSNALLALLLRDSLPLRNATVEQHLEMSKAQGLPREAQ